MIVQSRCVFCHARIFWEPASRTWINTNGASICAARPVTMEVYSGELVHGTGIPRMGSYRRVLDWLNAPL